MKILTTSSGTFRGPFNHDEPALTGETSVDISMEQFNQYLMTRNAEVNIPLLFKNGVFSLAPAESIRRQLVAILDAQPLGVQVFFKPVADIVKQMLQSGNIIDVKTIIETVPLPNTDLESVRQEMLVLFP